MTLKEKDYTNDEGLKDGSLLDDYWPIVLFENGKMLKDGQLLQAVEFFREGRRGIRLVRVGDNGNGLE